MSFHGEKPVLLYLDGTTNSVFSIQLLNRLAQCSGMTLTGYTLINPTTPLIWFQFVSAPGLEINPCASNVVQGDGFFITCDGATDTDTQLTPGRLIGAMQTSEIRQFRLVAKDSQGREHNPSTNRLFDTCILQFMFKENPPLRNPLYLMDVPTIQRTLDTI